MKLNGPTILILLLLFTFQFNISACTIFVLTNKDKTLFFNNEDDSNPVTRIWFQPSTNKYYGTAYLGYNDGWAQGGVNTQGLAFDWVAGFMDTYTPDKNMIQLKGNPSERMLERCATVEEAIAFYKKYAEYSFSSARILIADKTGESVIIGAKDGELFFEKSSQTRGFGYGMKTLDKMLNTNLQPGVEVGLPILEACLQSGVSATKYSNVFDLTEGSITVIPTFNEEKIKIDLKEEFSKGGHYYDIPNISSQSKKPAMALLPGMHRFPGENYMKVKDVPQVTAKVKSMLIQSAKGEFSKEDFGPDFWRELEPNLKEHEQQLRQLGKFESLMLVEKDERSLQKSYLYVVAFAKATILQRYLLDENQKITGLKNEAIEINTGFNVR